MWFTLCKFCLSISCATACNLRLFALELWNLQLWCTCAVGMREPGNHDNGAIDVWALTAYWRPFVTSDPLSWMPVNAEPLRMCTNVVYFRVMWRLYRREWNWLCVNQQTMTMDKGSWRVTSYSNGIYMYNLVWPCPDRLLWW